MMDQADPHLVNLANALAQRLTVPEPYRLYRRSWNDKTYPSIGLLWDGGPLVTGSDSPFTYNETFALIQPEYCKIHRAVSANEDQRNCVPDCLEYEDPRFLDNIQVVLDIWLHHYFIPRSWHALWRAQAGFKNPGRF